MRTTFVFGVALVAVLLLGTIAALLWRRHERRLAREIVDKTPEHPAHASRADAAVLEHELALALELDPRLESEVEARIAAIRLDVRDAPGACLAATRALELDATLVETYVVRGLARAELHDTKGAADDFAHVVAREPTHWRALALLGNCRAALDDTAGAIDAYNRTLVINPTCAMAFRRRGREELRLGLVLQAKADLDHAKALEPSDPAVWLDFARFHAAGHHLSRELESLNRALDLDPENAEALEYQRELRERLKRER